MAINENSADPQVAAIAGDNSAGGDGVTGTGRRGVVGMSTDYQGVYGHSGTNAGVVGEADEFHAVYGVSHSTHNGGLFGLNDSQGGFGAIGIAQHGDGVGVHGESPAIGVRGIGRQGVVGISTDYQGVYGKSTGNSGVVGESDGMHAVFAVTHSATSAGVFATNTAGGKAALFEGDCVVTGDLILAGADVAEQFEVVDGDPAIGPGSVVVLDDEGRLRTTQRAYDPRVVGVVSGAGDRVPALVLDRDASGSRVRTNRRPLAVVGKAWCLADAGQQRIQVGDLLTTSPRRGHAMRASDRAASFGAVIGKALTPLSSGIGLVLVLIGRG